MFLYLTFVLLLVTLGSVHLAEGARDAILHPKGVISEEVIFVVEVGIFIGYHVLMMRFVPDLLTRFPDERYVPACYLYIVINIIVHLLRLKKENRKSEHLYCGIFKLLWMTGLILYSILFVIAIQNWLTAYDWLVRTEAAYALCNGGYFLFIFFTEKETMSTTWRAESVTMDKTDEKRRMSLPFRTMYKEERDMLSNIWNQTPNAPQEGQRYDRKTVNRILVIIFIVALVAIFWICYLSENYKAGKYTAEEEPHEKIGLSSIIRSEDMEESVLNCLSERVNELLCKRFPDMDDTVLEAIKPILEEKAAQINQLAHYDIFRANTEDYEKYDVMMNVMPANIFQTLPINFEEVCGGKTELELSKDTPQLYMDIVEESIQRSIDEIVYGEEQMIETVAILSGEKFQIEASEWEKIFEAIFPQ